ncbi:hypothetical protein ACN47E_008953 [Coniothyrium glycines]
MPWTLHVATPGEDPTAYVLSHDGDWHVVVTNLASYVRLGVVDTLDPRLHTRLGQIALHAGYAKLESVEKSLLIASAHRAADHIAQEYELKPAAQGRHEILLLRDGDLIKSERTTSTLTCKWSPSEVQVNSSAADNVVVDSIDANDLNDAAEIETEDEDGDLGQAATAVLATQIKSQQSCATPMPALLHQRSVVVQETPTTARTLTVADFPAIPGVGEDSSDPTISKLFGIDAEQNLVEEAYSTARTAVSKSNISSNIGNADSALERTSVVGSVLETMAQSGAVVGDATDVATSPKRRSSPQVRPKANRKRSGSTMEGAAMDFDVQLDSQPSKRAKPNVESQNDTQDSRLSVIDVEMTPQTATKRRARISTANESLDPHAQTPGRSQRSSQRSATTIGDYEGPKPQVLLSNSSISKTSQAAKFLKKQGGAFIETMTESFNILCVRDGELHKTPKLLTAIARGIPIVTDKWLLNSAKSGRLLAVTTYTPSAPRQEKEWKVNLHETSGSPQTPFDGYTIHFTKSLKATYSPFSEIEQVCRAAGAKKVTSGRMDKTGDIIVLGVDENDGEVEKLTHEGMACFQKDIIAHSIFQGHVDLQSDDFKIGFKKAGIATTKDDKKRSRKIK